MQKATSALLLSLGALAFGCGRPTSLSALKAPPGKTLYVIHGGYLSCAKPFESPVNSETYTHALPMLQAASQAAGQPVPFVSSCFGTNHDQVYYSTDLRGGNNVVPTLQLADVIKDRLAALGPGADAVVVGHSYGGWLAMHDAVELAGVAPIRLLATIDPISWVTCPPGTLIGTLVGQVPASGPVLGCVAAPSDLASDDASIRDAVSGWDDFYQNQFSYLHSTPISTAGTVRHMSYQAASGGLAFEAHLLINRDQTVWAQIAADQE